MGFGFRAFSVRLGSFVLCRSGYTRSTLIACVSHLAVAVARSQSLPSRRTLRQHRLLRLPRSIHVSCLAHPLNSNDRIAEPCAGGNCRHVSASTCFGSASRLGACSPQAMLRADGETKLNHRLTMQPATRHDIAMLFARCLALFALYQPFIVVCSLLAGWSIGIFFGGDSLPEAPRDVLSFSALAHLTLSRLVAFVVLWRLAPFIATWISSVRPSPAKALAGSDVSGTPWAHNPGHTAQ